MGPRPILVKRAAKVDNQLECVTCKKRFWMTCKYIDHMSTHKHFSFSCNICNKGFSDQKQLDRHYITHKEVNTYDCKQCPRKFLQKNQLEQHMQFHFTLLPPNESPASTKKAVHFNNILESKNISEESSFSDSDFDEDYRFPILTKTRSGRIVKAKKLFDDEPEVKRRRKSLGEALKKGSENEEQLLRLKTVNKTNFVTEEPLSLVSSSTSPKKVCKKKLVVLVEKIPESVYKSCIANGNVYDLGSSNQKSINPNVSSSSQTKFLNHGSKVISKSCRVVTCELSRNLNQNNSKVTTVSCDPESSMASNCNQRVICTTSKKLVCKQKTDKAKTKTSSMSDVTSYKNSKTVASISTPQSPVKSMQNDRFPAENINSFLNNPSLPNQTNTKTYFYTSPQVNKQFLYVGPKQDINKIKNIIEELKAMPTPEVQTSENKVVASANSSRLSQNICIENTPNVGNLNVDTPKKESSRGTEYELQSSNGILEKRVLKDVILVKVTPELMQKMQRETLSAPQSHVNLELLDATTVSSVCPKDLNQVSCMTEDDEMLDLVQNETLQSGDGILESFNTTKSANILSVSLSLNKNLSQVSHMAEKNEELELTPTLHKKTLVSSQKRNGNSKSSSTYKPPKISSMPSSLNKNSSKVSRLTDKNRKPKLMKKVHRKMQRETLSASQNHRNLESLDATTVSSECPKDLNQISHTTEGNEISELVQKETLQSGHGNLESFSTAKPANNSSVSLSLNKNLSQVSHVAEKNEKPELTPIVHRKTLVSSQKINGNSKSFSADKSPNISSTLSSLNKNSSKVSRLTNKNRTPELMEKVHRKTSESQKRGHKNLKSFNAVRTASISPVSSMMNKDLNKISQVVGKNKTQDVMQKQQKRNLIFPQKEHGHLKSFSTVKTVNTSSVSSDMNKKASRVSHITEKHNKPELMQKVCRKSLVSPQLGCRNVKSFIVAKHTNISPVFSTENKDLTEVSQLRDKSETSELMQNVQKKYLMFPQLGHGNSKSSSAVRTANTLSLSSSMNKKLNKVSHITEGNRKSESMQKLHKKSLVPLQKGHKNLKSFIVQSPNISPVSSIQNKGLTEVSRSTEKNGLMRKVMCKTKMSLQRGHGSLESSSAVMPVNISSASASLNKDLTEVSESKEKNGLMPKVMSETEVSLQRGHGNLEPSNGVQPTNISLVSSSLNKTFPAISPATAKKGLMQKVISETEVSLQRRHGNLEPSSIVMSANISPVSSSLNKNLTEIFEPNGKIIEKNRLKQKVKSKTQVSRQKRHVNLEQSSAVMSVNISPMSSSLNKNLIEISEPKGKKIEKNRLKQKVKSKTQVSRQKRHVNLERSSAVMSVNISPMSSSLNKNLTEISEPKRKKIAKNRLKQKGKSKTQVSRHKHVNLEQSSAVMSVSISPMSSSLNKNLTEISEPKGKNIEKNILIQNVRSEAQVSLQTEHGNLEPSCTVLSANISPVSSHLNTDLTKISQPTENNILIQNVRSEAQVSHQRGYGNLEQSCKILSANFSPVSSYLNEDFTEVSHSTEKSILIQNVKSVAQVSPQRGHINLEPSSTVISANISPVSSSLNNNLTEISQSTEKSILIQNIKSEAQVSLKREHGNLEPSSTVMSANISPVSSSLNKDLTQVSQLTENSGLIQRVKSETQQVSQRMDHGNLEPCSAVLSANISPVSCTLNKNLNEVSQSTEENGIPKLLQKIKRETSQREHGNLESFQAPKPANISLVPSSLNKDLSKISHMTVKNKIKNVLKSSEVGLTCDSKIVDKSLKSQAVNCMNSDALTICQGTSNDTLSKTTKIPEEDIEFSISIDKKCAGTASSQSEHYSSSREKKLLARYKAKIEEKERKKREKYELKKRMRYVEKIHGRNNPNLTKLMLLFKEVYNESFALARNLEGNAESCLQSKTKSFITKIVPDVES